MLVEAHRVHAVDDNLAGELGGERCDQRAVTLPWHRHDHDVGLARGRGVLQSPDARPRAEASGRGGRTIRAAGSDENGVARHREPPREPAALGTRPAEDADDKIGHVRLRRVNTRCALPRVLVPTRPRLPRLALAGPAARICCCRSAMHPILPLPACRSRTPPPRCTVLRLQAGG